MAESPSPDKDINAAPDLPAFKLDGWNPEAPAGLHFLSLVPFASGYEVSENSQHDLKTKVKGHSGRRMRRSEFLKGRTMGRDIHDDKKLRNAVSTGDSGLVGELLDSGVDPQTYDDKKRTALHIAAAKGNQEIVSLLLAGGADPNQRDSLGNTPLHLAACTSHIPVVTLLLKAGTDVNALDQSGRSPLHLAVSRLHLLKIDSASSSKQLKLEVAEVVSMMRQYLECTGHKDNVTELEDLSSQLNHMTTRQEIDSLGALLTDFASLQIKKKTEPGNR